MVLNVLKRYEEYTTSPEGTDRMHLGERKKKDRFESDRITPIVS